jgi:hypothetical protein
MRRVFLLGYISIVTVSGGVSVAGELLGVDSGVNDPRRDASDFTLEGAVTCPTVTVGAGVFAGNANQWGNIEVPYNSATGGGTNVGGVAGITIPFGGSLAEYCRDHAKMRTRRALLELQLDERKVALNRLQQCVWVQKYFPSYASYINYPEFQPFKDCPPENSRILAEGVTPQTGPSPAQPPGANTPNGGKKKQDLPLGKDAEPPILDLRPTQSPVLVQPVR